MNLDTSVYSRAYFGADATTFTVTDPSLHSSSIKIINLGN